MSQVFAIVYIFCSGVKDKLSDVMQGLEERKKKQKSQVEDIQDYLQERGKVEARYAKELERVAKEFSEKSHGPSLR